MLTQSLRLRCLMCGKALPYRKSNKFMSRAWLLQHKVIRDYSLHLYSLIVQLCWGEARSARGVLGSVNQHCIS